MNNQSINLICPECGLDNNYHKGWCKTGGRILEIRELLQIGRLEIEQAISALKKEDIPLVMGHRIEWLKINTKIMRILEEQTVETIDRMCQYGEESNE